MTSTIVRDPELADPKSLKAAITVLREAHQTEEGVRYTTSAYTRYRACRVVSLIPRLSGPGYEASWVVYVPGVM